MRLLALSSVLAFAFACSGSDVMGNLLDGGATPDGFTLGIDGGDAASKLKALTTGCARRVGGDYRTDDVPALPENIPICGLTGALFWNADMDIDCDGKQTSTCNLGTDPDYQNQTSATDSVGNPLDAATLPYVVVPLPSTRFDYTKSGLEFGSVILVLYNGRMSYGVFGDEGPSNIIGESSVAMATSLGIDANPKTGGIDSGVTYVAFVGKSGVVSKIEDHNQAVTVGQARLADLLQNN